jgi:hypothetical protein
MSAESNLLRANQRKEYCDLELIPTEQSDRSVRKIQSILSLIEKLWQNAIAALAKEPELKVWQKQDRHGRIYWHAYDPLTDKSVSFDSEAVMRCWIESSYSR